MKINRYFPFAFVYFFINSFALPFGLTFTALLSPVFYRWVVVKRRSEIIIPFFVLLSPFVIAHLVNGVNFSSYVISILNFAAVYIFCQAFYTFLIACHDKEKIFRRLLLINFILCIIAIPLYFTSWDTVLWMKNALTEGVKDFKRLKLFTYEASFYATLFTPLFFYFLWQICLKQNKINSWALLIMLALPFILSFSMGVIACIMMAAFLTYLIYVKRLTRKKRVRTLLSIVAVISLLILGVLWLFPDNTIFTRLENIITGHDTSGKGRTSDAFILAGQMLEKKSEIWGVGAGQVKIIGADIVKSYYLYDLGYDKIAIPNAAAETLAIFGWVGFCARILIEIFLFFYTKIWMNYYRLALFFFIFFYQFTGSFITNVAEYVIWIIAFTPAFPQFNVIKEKHTV
jgi:hypothetical protein